MKYNGEYNNYPSHIINATLVKVIKKLAQELNIERQRRNYISAPYIRGTSKRAARILKNYDIQLSGKSTKTLKNKLCQLNDKRRNEEKCGVVYKLSCKDCDSAYVGETGR